MRRGADSKAWRTNGTSWLSELTTPMAVIAAAADIYQAPSRPSMARAARNWGPVIVIALLPFPRSSKFYCPCSMVRH
jgi:hypothetical protein